MNDYSLEELERVSTDFSLIKSSSNLFLNILSPYDTDEDFYKLRTVFSGLLITRYIPIWNLALTHARLQEVDVISVREAFKTGLQSLKLLEKKASEALLGIVSQSFSGLSDLEDVLQHYIKVGRYISQSPEALEFVNTLYEINKLGRRRKFGAFVFVCAPSGTGKTTLPFSLSIPFLYFVHKPAGAGDDIQAIYTCFNEHSKLLQSMVVKDLQNYRTNFPSRSSSNFHRHLVIDVLVNSQDQKFYVIGFLVAMIKKVIAQWRVPGETRNFSHIQASLNDIEFPPMTFEQGKTELRNLGLPEVEGPDGFRNFILPIFLDECSLKDGRSTSLEFLLLRNIICCIRCTPIFMGSDAKAANFLVNSQTRGSRIENYSRWCLIWNRLPVVSPDILRERHEEARRLIARWRSESQNMYLYPSNAALDFIFEYLKSERPLFLDYTLNFLKHLTTASEVPQSDYDFLCKLLEDILDQFRNSKGDMAIFNNGQLAYISSVCWKKEAIIAIAAGFLFQHARYCVQIVISTATWLSCIRFLIDPTLPGTQL